MAYWPDVTRGEKVRHHMLLENNIRHMINSLDGFGSTLLRGTSNGVVRIQIWNSSSSAFVPGQPVAFDSEKDLCGDALPAVPVTDKTKPWGVCVNALEVNGIGDCIISGPATVALTGSSGDYAEPDGTGFKRSSSGIARILYAKTQGNNGVILLGGGGGGGYNGQWAVQLDRVYYFKVPASSFGNLILTEDRVFATVHDELVSPGFNHNDIAWCYLRVSMERGVSLLAYNTPFQNLFDYADYPDDYVPLAVYSPETGLIQLQYGPVRLNRYWIYDDGSGSESGGGGEAL